MYQNKISAFLMANENNFTLDHKMAIRQRLETMSDDKFYALLSATNHLKNPSFYWVASLFVGYLGLDRFLVGDNGLGILKLITAGGLGIWWIVDLFLIKDKVREQNYLKVMPYLA